VVRQLGSPRVLVIGAGAPEELDVETVVRSGATAHRKLGGPS
jgi:hypothetical protein